MPDNTDDIFDFPDGSEIPSIPAEVIVVKSTSVSRGEEIEKMIANAMTLNDKQVLHEPTCKICSSPHRKEIEQKYSETTKLVEAKKLFKEKTGEDVELVVFENHMMMHLSQGVREIQKGEYAQRIKRVYNQNLNTVDRISSGFAILMERIVGVNSLIPSSSESAAEIEKIKSAETARLMGVIHNLLKLQASILGEMKSSGELMTIPSKEFVDTFISAIQNSKTDRERETLKNLLDKLENLAKRTQI